MMRSPEEHSLDDSHPTGDELRLFFDLSLDLMCIADFEGRFRRANAAWHEALGYSLEEILAVPYTHFVHPEDLAGTQAEARKLQEGEVTLCFENRYRRKDGTYIWLTWRAKPDVERRLILAVARDVTRQKEVEQELLSAVRIQQEIMDNTMAVAFIKDPEGRYQMVNRRWREIFDLKPEQILGKTDEEIFTPEMAAAFRENDRRVLEMGEPLITEELAPQTDGVHTYLSVKFPLKDICGRIHAVGGIATDITDRKRAEEELRRSNRELEQFAYVASHDLQEPLRIVTSFLQLLERRYKPQLNSEAIEYIDAAISAANRMRALIRDLLQLSRVGRRPRPLEPVDSGEVLDQTLENLRLSIEESGAVIRRDVDMPKVLSDPTLLGQVFQNLIANAIKFHGKAPPKIEIKARRQNGAWLFSVQDHGVGIEEKFFDRVFEIFRRLDPSGSVGTGIGLAICKRIIESQSGRIWVQSKPGEGSTFFFTLHGVGNAIALAPPNFISLR